MNSSTPIAKWFMPVAVIAVIWNLMGVVAFFMSPLFNPKAMELLTDTEQALYTATPPWAIAAFAIAVCSGAIGSLLIALKKAVAKPILIVSLVAILVQMYHAYFINNSWAVFGPDVAIRSIVVIVFAIYLVFLSKHAIAKHWIR